MRKNKGMELSMLLMVGSKGIGLKDNTKTIKRMGRGFNFTQMVIGKKEITGMEFLTEGQFITKRMEG